MVSLIRTMENAFKEVQKEELYDHNKRPPATILRSINQIMSKQDPNYNGLSELVPLVKKYNDSVELQYALARAFAFSRILSSAYKHLDQMIALRNDFATYEKIVDFILKFDIYNKEKISYYFTKAFMKDTSNKKYCQMMVDFVYSFCDDKHLYALKYIDYYLASGSQNTSESSSSKSKGSSKSSKSADREKMLFNGGKIAIEHKVYNKALVYYKELLDNYKEKYDYCLHYGASFVYDETGVNKEEGKKWLEKAMKLRPDEIDPKIHMAHWYARTSRFQETIDWIDSHSELRDRDDMKLLRLNEYTKIHGASPETDALYLEHRQGNEAGSYVSIGIDHACSRLVSGDVDGADEIVQELLDTIPEDHPNYSRVELEKMDILGARGEYHRAFKMLATHYWTRMKSSTLAYGKEPWEGNDTGTLSVVCDQGGVGDYIFATRFLPFLCTKAKIVWWFVDERLEKFYKQSDVLNECKNLTIFSTKFARIAENGDDVCDLLLSCARFCPEEYYTRPILMRPVSPLSNKVGEIIRKIGGTSRPIILFNMYGKTQNTQLLEFRRRIPARSYLPLFDITRVAWVTVQRDIPANDRKLLEEKGVTIAEDIDEDFAFKDTMQIIAKSSLVVTNDTSLVHLAGTMNARTALLLSTYPHWYWNTYSEMTPYYPSVRIFRQEKWGDWSAPMQRVKELIETSIL